MTLTIPRLKAGSKDFAERLQAALAWDALTGSDIKAAVETILEDVRSRGDQALLALTRRYDRLEADSIAALRISHERLQAARSQLPAAQLAALETAADRIRRFHEKQKQGSWQYTDPDGSVFGQKVTPIERVGIYVPGGKASYPSTVLMDAVPARVAGVRDIVAMVPTPDGEVNELVLAALAIAGVDEVYTIGGAQAVAALAYGTESIAAVDKIVGPGNVYVAMAKQLVYGRVGIDMIAGPSEILVICDGLTDPDWIAMDMFSQAEHDEDAQAILISPDSAYLTAVENSMNRLLPGMEREVIIRQSLQRRGLFIEVASLAEAAVVSNRIAPEHLELSVEKPRELLALIEHAGAVFLGRHTSEALGDYCAGPSHVLPTSGTARFSSGLSVLDFQKRSSIIECSPQLAAELADTASGLARAEGLTAHARSAEYRGKRSRD